MAVKNTWTEAMDKRLAELVADPLLSYSRIADIMSREYKLIISKSACIGRSHRCHLPARPSPIPTRRSAPEKMLRLNPVRSPVPLPAPQRGGRVGIYELGFRCCRYPFGANPPYLYCGEPTLGGSYCEMHWAKVYLTPKVRA